VTACLHDRNVQAAMCRVSEHKSQHSPRMPHLFAPNTKLAPRRIEAQELRAIQRGRAVSGATAACSLIIASSSRFAALLFLSFACTRLRALTCSQRWVGTALPTAADRSRASPTVAYAPHRDRKETNRPVGYVYVC
jgi:hypothetical protein